MILVPTHPTGNRFECPQCRGIASTKADLGIVLGIRRRTALLRMAADHMSYLKCPFCASPMTHVEVEIAAGTMGIECCRHCESVWLDHGQFAHLSSIKLDSVANDEMISLLATQPRKGRRLVEMLRSLFKSG